MATPHAGTIVLGRSGDGRMQLEYVISVYCDRICLLGVYGHKKENHRAYRRLAHVVLVAKVLVQHRGSSDSQDSMSIYDGRPQSVLTLHEANVCHMDRRRSVVTGLSVPRRLVATVRPHKTSSLAVSLVFTTSHSQGHTLPHMAYMTTRIGPFWSPVVTHLFLPPGSFDFVCWKGLLMPYPEAI